MMFPEQIVADKHKKTQIEQTCISAIHWLARHALISTNMYGSKRSKWITYHVGDMIIDRMIGRSVDINIINNRSSYSHLIVHHITQIEIVHTDFLISYYTPDIIGIDYIEVTKGDDRVSWVGNIDTFENEVTFAKLVLSD
jgi:hypothetical protein